MKITGIYKIQSIVHPDRTYIGSSIDIYNRWKQHKRNLIRCDSHHPKLRDHVKKYGISDLEFSILEEFEFISKQHLLEREQYYLDNFDHWFNINDLANSRLGTKMSKESRKKMSDARIGIKVSEETRKRMSEAKRKKKWSNFSKEKLSKSMIGNRNSTGVKRTAEFIERVIERNKKLGLVPPSRLGVKYTEEEKRIIKEKRLRTIEENKLRKLNNT